MELKLTNKMEEFMRMLSVCMLLALLGGCASTGQLKDMEKKMDEKMLEMRESMKSSVKSELKEEMKDEILKGARDELVMELKAEVYKEVNKSLDADRAQIAEVVKSMGVKFEEYKEIVRRAIAEELVNLRRQVGNEVEIALTEGPFIKNLEAKILDNMTQISAAQVEGSKAAVVKSCVEEALDELVVKQIGVKASDIRVINN